MDVPSQSDLVCLYLGALEDGGGPKESGPADGVSPSGAATPRRTVEAIGEVLELNRETTAQRVGLLSTLEDLVAGGLVSREGTDSAGATRPRYRLTEEGREHARELRERVRSETVTITADEEKTVKIEELDSYFESYPVVRALTRLDRKGRIRIQDAVGGEFVDRERELEQLRELLEKIPQEGSRTVLVTGEAGAGKTTLVERILEQAREKGFHVGTGRCRPEGNRPYGPLLDAFRDLPDNDALTDPLESITYEVDDYEAFDAQRTAMFNEIADAVRIQSESRPLVVFLDDVQWAGPDTRRLFGHLTRTVTEWLYPVLFVATCRSSAAVTEEGGLLSELSDEDRTIHVSLGPLPEADSHGLVAWLANTPDIPEQILEKLREQTGGNPLLLRETVTQLREEGVFDPEEPLDIPTDPSELPTPADVTAVVESRLDALPAPTREVLEAAAVADEAVSPELIAAVLEEAEPTVNEHLDVLVTGRFLTRTDDGVTFPGGLVRRSIVESLPEPRRRKLHQAVAAAIESTATEPTEEAARIAHHYEEADTPRAALDYYRQAGDTARTVYAHEDALDRYERALAMARECADGRAALELLELLGQTAATLGRYGRAREYFETARERADEVSDRRRLFQQTGETFNAQGDFESAIGAVDTGLALGEDATGPGRDDSAADAPPDSATVAGLLQVKAHALTETGRPDRAREAATQARECAKQAETPAQEALALRRLGYVEQTQGNYGRATEHLQDSLALARDLDDRQKEARSLKLLGTVAVRRGDLEDAERYYEGCLSICREIGDRQSESASLHNLGYVAETRGELDAAQQYYEESLGLDRELGDREGESHTLQSLGRVASDRGDVDAAREYYEESLELDRELGDRRGEATSLYNLGVLEMNCGNLDRAQGHFEESLAINREIGDRHGESASLHNLGNVAETRGQLDAAEGYYEEGLAIQREIGYQQGEASTLLSLGRLARHRGHLDTAAKQIEEGLEQFQDVGDRRSEAEGYYEFAEIDRLRGDLASAREHLEECLTITREIDYPLGETKARCSLAELALEEGALGDAESEIERAREIAAAIDATDCEGGAVLASARLALERDALEAAEWAVETGLNLVRDAGDRAWEIRGLLVRARIEREQETIGDAVDACERALELARESGFTLLALDALCLLADLEADSAEANDRPSSED